MTPDYDLSNLPASQADLWIYLQVDAVLGQILADQADRLGFPLALGAGGAANSWNRWIGALFLGGGGSFDY
jgi:hypothetical protein